ncbi:thiamine phosphate synthase YjbQ (UPF0047 family) [Parabacteroides sp. PFB2-10]|uniref:AAA family ATPase n=1 Tax=Parabacteroides sp. PFB2-10 TaxID=1742405 RepID=UPI002473B0AF|nr:AAA family ATPase [Parabacteroides sp. PFB2-10]MDH6312490.1 thiamine phosphate synthase YjbQ (UPF0047 family) [Parabacteroides sp. PFB2-10]
MRVDLTKFTEHEPDQVDTAADILAGCVIDITKDYPPVQFLLRDRYGNGLISRGDLCGMKGKAKAGKTFACAALETAILSGGYMGFTAEKDCMKVLHVDTEQNVYNVAEKARMVYDLCGWPTSTSSDRYIPLTLREYNAAQRLERVRAAIDRYRPDCVYIDGIRDLCKDFNDIGESGVLIGELMKLSSRYECAILCVLHENKGDGNMRGHLGTELLNKCSETYQVSRDSNSGIITVEQTECRNAPISKWAFSIDEEGQLSAENVISKEDEKKEDLRQAFESIFSQRTRYRHTDLTQAYMVRSGVKDRTARNRIQDAVNTGIISKQDDGAYTLGDFSDDLNGSAPFYEDIYR